MSLLSEEIVLTYEDFKGLFLRHRKTLFRGALYCFAAIFLFLLLREPRYETRATFKQSSQSSEMHKDFQSLFKFAGLKGDGGAIHIMTSEKLLGGVVAELGLQMRVKERGAIARFFSKIYRNSSMEFGFAPVKQDSFTFGSLTYDQESPLQLFIQFCSPEQFLLLDAEKKFLAKAKVGQPVRLPHLQFILEKTPASLQLEREYALDVLPKKRVVNEILSSLVIKPTTGNSNLLLLKFNHPVASVAASIPNKVMAHYQKFLKEEYDEIANIQLALLNTRQEELTQKLDLALTEYASYLGRTLGEEGFMGLNQEIEMLAIPKMDYTSKLFDLDLRLQRSKKARENFIASRPIFFKKKEREFFHAKRSEVEGPAVPYAVQSTQFQKRLVSLDFEKDKWELLVPKSTPLTLWNESEFSGIDLETAQRLCIDYTRERDTLQSKLRQLWYLIEQLDHADFELTSVNSMLTDSIAQDMVKKASELALQLCEENNRSPREQERLKEALAAQKKFLTHHLHHSVELLNIHLSLLEEKIAALQKVTIDLIQTEKGLVQTKLQELSSKMGHLPEKWRLENHLKLKKDLSMNIIESLAQLSESKIWDLHLYQVECRPLDSSTMPSSPRAPHLLLFSSVGALLGFSSLFFTFFVQGVRRGLPLTLQALKTRMLNISGVISSDCEAATSSRLNAKDLETLRNICSFLLANGKVAALLQGKNPNYAHPLCELLSLRGLKVLLINAAFDRGEKCQQGLYQFLMEETGQCAVQRRSSYDYLPAGAVSHQGTELLARDRFTALLAHYKSKYDLVLISNSADITHAEARELLNQTDLAIISLKEQSFRDLQGYEHWLKKRGNNALSFVIFQ